MDFITQLETARQKNNSLLCIGLDPDQTKIPNQLGAFEFCKEIVDATADLVCAYKPNSAFFESRGADGIAALKRLCQYVRSKDLPVILDYKRGDIGNSNEHYAKFAFEYLEADAITVQPYQGQAAVQAFLDHKDKGIIVLCRTSNEGAGEFQDLDVSGQPLYLKVAQNVAHDWNANGNCMLVVGATAPDELARVREAVGDQMYLLVPGVGAQGGDVAATLKAGGDKLIINSSRAVLYASDGPDFAAAARTVALESRNEINKYRR